MTDALPPTPGILPTVEAWSGGSGPVGVVVLHGFTGNPSSVRPLAEALVEAGFRVEVPRLPGHGTTIEDMIGTGWEDWRRVADEAYLALQGRCEQVVVAGLSMGGALTLWLAAHHRAIAGIVCINAVATPPDPQVPEMVRLMLDAGDTVSPGIGSDIADPDVVESAYDGSPLAPALSLFEALGPLSEELGRITCPVLLLTSREDHVVDPANSDHIAATVSGPVERVTLERSYHVATLDFDRELVAEHTIGFVRKVTASS